MSFPLGWHFKVADCGVGIFWELWSHVLGICLCFVVPVLIWWLLLAFFFPRPLETPSHERKLFSHETPDSGEICTETNDEFPRRRARGMHSKLTSLLPFEQKPTYHLTYPGAPHSP